MEFIQLTDDQSKKTYLPQVWPLLETSYSQVPGGLHFTSPEHVIADTDEWHLIVENGQVQALTLHKYKCGLKLVALAKAKGMGTRAALKQLIDYALRHGWMELSDRAETFVMRECNGHQFMIHASLAGQLLKKIVLPAGEDTFHYRREIMHCLKTKLLLGTPNFAQAS